MVRITNEKGEESKGFESTRRERSWFGYGMICVCIYKHLKYLKCGVNGVEAFWWGFARNISI